MTESAVPIEPFIDQIMRAIVKQFFEAPPIVMTDGGAYSQYRSTPVQQVAERLLVDKKGELLDIIMEKLDMDVLAQAVAEKVAAILTKPNGGSWGASYDPNRETRNALMERVNTKLVELMAADMFKKLRENGGMDDDSV